MFLSSEPGDGFIPHRTNIDKIHARLRATQALDALEPVYAGGYPSALLLAPRNSLCPTRFSGEYFTDLDLYGRTDKHVAKMIEELDKWSWNDTFESERAKTYKSIRGPEIQVIKFLVGEPEEIICNFDFVNCAIAFQPQTKKMFFHSELFKYHLESELQTLNPWMLELTGEEGGHSYALSQIKRFKKYLNRWDLSLSEEALHKLLAVYKEFPDIEIPSGTRYYQGSGATPTQTTISTSLWRDYADVFENSEYWDPEFDFHGRIISPEPQPIEVDTSNIAVGAMIPPEERYTTTITLDNINAAAGDENEILF